MGPAPSPGEVLGTGRPTPGVKATLLCRLHYSPRPWYHSSGAGRPQKVILGFLFLGYLSRQHLTSQQRPTQSRGGHS